MGLQLPAELASLLSWLGFSWPEGDEEKMFEVGQAWLGLAGELTGRLTEAEAAARHVWDGNSGEAINAFRSTWTGERSPATNLREASHGAQHMGVAMIVCAQIVLALKINVIVQLVLLAIQIAQAIATAVITAGASLLQIPVFRIISKLIIDQLIGLALGMILNA